METFDLGSCSEDIGDYKGLHADITRHVEHGPGFVVEPGGILDNHLHRSHRRDPASSAVSMTHALTVNRRCHAYYRRVRDCYGAFAALFALACSGDMLLPVVGTVYVSSSASAQMVSPPLPQTGSPRALDIVVANWNDAGQDIWRNDGLGSFTAGSLGSGNSAGITLGDIDGDGDADVLVANTNTGQDIWINDGAGGFTATSFGAGVSRDVELGDLDGDGDLDVVVANYNEPQDVWINDGSGSFSAFSYGGGNSRAVGLGDLDGDGDLDAVFANRNQGQDIWINDGSAGFTQSSLGGGASLGIAVGDLDGDSDVDVLVGNTNNGAQEVWFNDGSASFVIDSQGSGDTAAVALGDLDGDGDLDAAVVDFNQPSEVWINQGLGTFTLNTIGSGTTKALGVSIGDLDGDGDLDVVLANWSNVAERLWTNDGSGSFVATTLPREHDCGGGGDWGICLVCRRIWGMRRFRCLR